RLTTREIAGSSDRTLPMSLMTLPLWFFPARRSHTSARSFRRDRVRLFFGAPHQKCDEADGALAGPGQSREAKLQVRNRAALVRLLLIHRRYAGRASGRL